MEQLAEIEAQFQEVEGRLLKVAFNGFLDGSLPEDAFTEFLNTSGLAKRFLVEYMDADPSDL